MFKLVHDDSYIENAKAHNYIIVKVFDDTDTEVGQVKLDVLDGKLASQDTDTDSLTINQGEVPAHIHVTVSGNISHVSSQHVKE